MKPDTRSVLLALCVSLLSVRAALAVSDDFSTNPLLAGSPWSFGVGSNANNQFTWTPGLLQVHVDTRLPTARLDLPLGTTLSDTSSFQLSARFSFQVEEAGFNQFAQFAFGLTNHTLTGGDRTGSVADFTSDNVFHTVEFNYFPNLSNFGGPVLTPSVFGGQFPGNDAFANFASIFGSDSDLGDNTVGVNSLPQDTPLEVQMAFDGTTRVLTMSMFTVGAGDVLTPLLTEVPALDLVAFGSSYDIFNPFQVNSLSLMAYHDGFTTAEFPSLVGDITFDFVSLVIVPEPSTLWLAALGAVASLVVIHRGRQTLKSSLAQR